MVFTSFLKACTLSALCLCTCCGPIADMRETLNPDLIPPQLLGVHTVNAGQLELAFNEPPVCRPIPAQPAGTTNLVEVTMG